jgi:hypothetical protein
MSRETVPVPIAWPTPDGAPAPQNGDLVLCCAHTRSQDGSVGTGVHIFHVFDGGITYERDDGTTATAQWIGMCHACFRAHKDRPLECPFTTDALLAKP